MSAPTCIECHKAKHKCDKHFPCKRCVEFGLECFPHQGKHGRPSKRPTCILMNVMETLHCYSEHLTGNAQEKIADLISAMYIRTYHINSSKDPAVWGVSFSDIPVPKGSTNKRGFLLQRLTQLANSYTEPPEEQTATELQNLESWIPPSLLAVRDLVGAHFGAATLFEWRSFGVDQLELNHKFVEMFGSKEEIEKDNRQNQKTWSHTFLNRWVKGSSEVDGFPNLNDAPELLPRIVARCEMATFALKQIQAIMRSTSDCHGSTAPAIIQMVLHTGKLQLCQIETHLWLGAGGERAGRVISIIPMPDSPYLQISAVEDVPVRQPRKKRRVPAKAQGEGPEAERVQLQMQSVPQNKTSMDTTAAQSSTGPDLSASSDQFLFADEEAFGAIMFDLQQLLDPGSDSFELEITTKEFL